MGLQASSHFIFSEMVFPTILRRNSPIPFDHIQRFLSKRMRRFAMYASKILESRTAIAIFMVNWAISSRSYFPSFKKFFEGKMRLN